VKRGTRGRDWCKNFKKKELKIFRRGGATVVALRPPRRKPHSSPEKMKIHLLRPSSFTVFQIFFREKGEGCVLERERERNNEKTGPSFFI